VPGQQQCRQRGFVGKSNGALRSVATSNLPGAFDNGIRQSGIAMKTMHSCTVTAISAAVLLGLGGYSGMSTRDKDKDMAIGAGVIGHEVGKDKK
jgi:hypothetical protein